MGPVTLPFPIPAPISLPRSLPLPLQVGDSIVYNQRKRLILGDLIKETLELLEVR